MHYHLWFSTGVPCIWPGTFCIHDITVRCGQSIIKQFIPSTYRFRAMYTSYGLCVKSELSCLKKTSSHQWASGLWSSDILQVCQQVYFDNLLTSQKLCLGHRETCWQQIDVRTDLSNLQSLQTDSRESQWQSNLLKYLSNLYQVE